MAFFYRAPTWFIGWDIALELVFGIVTALVAFFSLRIYKLCQERECRVLGLAFSSISVSYFLWSLINIFAFFQLGRGVSIIVFKEINFLLLLGIYIHVIFFILGLSTLAYLSFGTKNHRLYALLVSLSIIVVIFSSNVGLAFNFVSALLLFYVGIDYFGRYKKSEDSRTFLIYSSFILLFVARASFVFSTVNPTVYVANHFFELGGYALLLVSLIKAIKK